MTDEDSLVTNQCGNDSCVNAAVKQGTTGPQRRYCSNRCRQAAYRQRRHDQPVTVAETDPIADAVAHLNTTFAALPSTAKLGDYGHLIMRLSETLDQFQRATARRQRNG